MKRGSILSAILHLAVLLLIVFGLPSIFDFKWWKEREVEEERTITVTSEPPALEIAPAEETVEETAAVDEPPAAEGAVSEETPRPAAEEEPPPPAEAPPPLPAAASPQSPAQPETPAPKEPMQQKTPTVETPTSAPAPEEPQQDSLSPESVETQAEPQPSEENTSEPVPPDEHDLWQPATMVAKREDLVPLPELNDPEWLKPTEPAPVPLPEREIEAGAPSEPRIATEPEDETTALPAEPSRAATARAEKPEAGELIGKDGEAAPNGQAPEPGSGEAGQRKAGEEPGAGPKAPEAAAPESPEAEAAPAARGIDTEGAGTGPRRGSPEAPRANVEGVVAIEIVPVEPLAGPASSEAPPGARAASSGEPRETEGAAPPPLGEVTTALAEAPEELRFEEVHDALERPVADLDELGRLIDALLGEALAPVDPASPEAAALAVALRTEAEGGQVEEQFLLGELYREGMGVAANAKLAAEWHGKAAEKRYVAAQIRFGYENATGEGVPRDLVAAYMWFSLAAVQGDLLGARGRDVVAKMMTREQVFEAEKRALQTRQVWSNWERFARLNMPNIGSDLVAAARAGDAGKVKRLLDQGADVNALDDQGRSALLWAAINEHSDVSLALLARGADPNVQDENGKSALMWAADNGDQATVEAMLRKDIDVNARDDFGETALINAAWSGRERIVEILLAKGAAIDFKDNFGATAMIWSAINGHLPVAELLAGRGADIEAKDGDGLTALMRAAWNDHPELVRYLLEQGADPYARDKQDRTALDLALSENNEEAVRALREAMGGAGG